MKGIILYKSKYGATRRYAGWLAEETGFDCMETGRAKIENVKQYDTIILGGGIHASGIAGLSFLKKHIGELQGKRIIVFCDGASPYEKKAFQQLYDRNMKGPLAGLPCFYCRGSWDMERMSFADRTLCRMLIKAVAKKKPEDLDPWERGLLEVETLKCDWTDRSYLAPVIRAVNENLPEAAGTV